MKKPDSHLELGLARPALLAPRVEVNLGEDISRGEQRAVRQGLPARGE